MKKLLAAILGWLTLTTPSLAQEQELIRVPLRVAFLEASYEPLNVDEQHRDISDVLEVVNLIWSQAAIEFYIDYETDAKAENDSVYGEIVAHPYATNREKVPALRSVCPPPKRGEDGIELCVIGNTFSPTFGGVAFPTAPYSPWVIWPVEFRDRYQPNPATLAHEIGHALGLPHNDKADIYLMRGDGNNIRRKGRYDEILLSEDEIETAREHAREHSGD